MARAELAPQLFRSIGSSNWGEFSKPHMYVCLQLLHTNQQDRLAAEPVDERQAHLQQLCTSQQERLAVGSSSGLPYNALNSLVTILVAPSDAL